jgi:DegV family protein with EDD domain
MMAGEKVRVIDTRTVSASLALLALGVQQRLERGTTDEEVDEFVARYGREHHLLFTVNTLEYLAKGGRIGKAAAMAGQLLHIKPILTLADGEVLPLKKVRGAQKAYREFERTFSDATTDGPGLRVGIAHAESPERLEALRRMVRKVRPQAEIELATTLGPVVGTHAGPGTVGFFWFSDPDAG